MTEDLLLDSLVQALESQLDSVTYYFDRRDQQVVVVDEELGEAPPDFESTSNRFFAIPRLTNNERYQIMEDFIETQDNEQLQDELTQALLERGAFTAFEKALERYPTRRELWNRFRQERVRVHARAWLSTNGLH